MLWQPILVFDQAVAMSAPLATSTASDQSSACRQIQAYLSISAMWISLTLG